MRVGLHVLFLFHYNVVWVNWEAAGELKLLELVSNLLDISSSCRKSV